MPTYRVIPIDQLSPGEILRWSQIQQQNPNLDSPFFNLEYVQSVAEVRQDICVAIVEDLNHIRAFFPFQIDEKRCAQAVGGKICEFQGALCETQFAPNVGELIRESGIAIWRFDHLPVNQIAFQPYITRESQSPFMDLNNGFEEYLQNGISKSGTYQSTRRKQRKLIREVGPLRFEFHTAEPSVIDQLLEWKMAQYVKTSTLNFFDYPWIVELLRNLQHTQSANFSGVVSALYCNNQLIAVHHGIRNQNVLHIWFPTYNQSFEKYSPGLILLLELAKEAASNGIKRIDFGKGDERYKTSFQSDQTPVAVGSIDTRPILGTFREGWQMIKRSIRSSKMRTTFESLMKASNQARERKALR